MRKRALGDLVVRLVLMNKFGWVSLRGSTCGIVVFLLKQLAKKRQNTAKRKVPT